MGTGMIPPECVLWLLERVSISIAEKCSYVCDYSNLPLGSSVFILEDPLSNVIIFHFYYLLWGNSTDRWQLWALAFLCAHILCHWNRATGDGVFQMVKRPVVMAQPVLYMSATLREPIQQFPDRTLGVEAGGWVSDDMHMNLAVVTWWYKVWTLRARAQCFFKLAILVTVRKRRDVRR